MNAHIEQAKENVRDISSSGRDSSMIVNRITECLTSALSACKDETEKDEVTQVAQAALEEVSQRHLIADTLADTRDADAAMSALVKFIHDNSLPVKHYMVEASKNTALNQMMRLSRLARDTF